MERLENVEQELQRAARDAATLKESIVVWDQDVLSGGEDFLTTPSEWSPVVLARKTTATTRDSRAVSEAQLVDCAALPPDACIVEQQGNGERGEEGGVSACAFGFRGIGGAGYASHGTSQ